MDTSTLLEAVGTYIEAFERADLNLIRNLFAEDAIQEDPVGSPACHGMDEILEFYKAGFARGMKPKLTGKPRCAGSSVAFSLDAVMNKMTVSPIDVFDFNADGKIKRMRSYWGPENFS